MLKYLLLTLPGSIVLTVSFVTPVMIVIRSRKSSRLQPANFEVFRFKAVASISLWLVPSLIIWTFFGLILWVLSWEVRRPEPGRFWLPAPAPEAWRSVLTGY